MKLTRSFFILLCILFILCVILYSIQKEFIQEGLTVDNPDGIKEAKAFETDIKFGNKSSYIKILPLKNLVSSSNSSSRMISSMPDISALPISQYTVKSSYNSACSGKGGIITNEMLTYVLSRGCRFIDFEIANISGKPYVVSPNYNSSIAFDKNKIKPLDDILETAVTYGITDSPGSAKNFKDPLFIHLRVNPDPSYNFLYQDIASSIYNKIGDKLYNFSSIKSGFVSNIDIEPFHLMNIEGFKEGASIQQQIDAAQKAAAQKAAAQTQRPTIIPTTIKPNTVINTVPTTFKPNTVVNKVPTTFKPNTVPNTVVNKVPTTFKPNTVPNTVVNKVPTTFKPNTVPNTVVNKVPTTIKPNTVPNTIVTTNQINNILDINKTKMSEIMGKIIILLDYNYDTNWRNKSKCTSGKKNCYDLNNFVHIETGIGNTIINSPTTILKQSQMPIQIGKDGISTMNSILNFILPDSDIAILKQTKMSNASNAPNPDFTNLMLNWSCNFITNRFFIQDTNLRAYEDFFNEHQTAIIPLSYVKKYYTQKQIDNIKK